MKLIEMNAFVSLFATFRHVMCKCEWSCHWKWSIGIRAGNTSSTIKPKCWIYVTEISSYWNPEYCHTMAFQFVYSLKIPNAVSNALPLFKMYIFNIYPTKSCTRFRCKTSNISSVQHYHWIISLFTEWIDTSIIIMMFQTEGFDRIWVMAVVDA